MNCPLRQIEDHQQDPKLYTDGRVAHQGETEPGIQQRNDAQRNGAHPDSDPLTIDHNAGNVRPDNGCAVRGDSLSAITNSTESSANQTA